MIDVLSKAMSEMCIDECNIRYIYVPKDTAQRLKKRYKLYNRFTYKFKRQQRKKTTKNKTK